VLRCQFFSRGRYFARKWASLGITTVGAYVNERFGKEAVQFYTWVGMLFKIIAMGVALYSFATIISSLIILSPEHFLADPATGKLSRPTAIIISGILMLFYAVSGGLWAVLIVDAIQFVVLTVTVLFVVPLCFGKVGGVSQFLLSVPKDFMAPASGNFTYWFLLGWIVVHTFKLGGEWVFIQRFLAVSSPRNAQKSSYLFGTLYLISPIIWMLPPMIYRIMNPAANPEQAYILACASVLPAGMMGLLVAAMFSSAASSIDGEVNVYAGAVTNDFYKLLINPQATEKQLVLVGRISSFLIGAVIMFIALTIPYFGGAEKVILTITGLLAVSMVLPVLWGLYFGGIRQNAIWYATGASFITAAFAKLFIPLLPDNAFHQWYQGNSQLIEVLLGIFVPLSVLTFFELKAKRKMSLAYLFVRETDNHNKAYNEQQNIHHFPARILGYSIIALGVLISTLVFTAGEHAVLIGFFAAVLLLIGLVIIALVRKPQKASMQVVKTNEILTINE
jgi:Na+/proline symporter